MCLFRVVALRAESLMVKVFVVALAVGAGADFDGGRIAHSLIFSVFEMTFANFFFLLLSISTLERIADLERV